MGEEVVLPHTPKGEGVGKGEPNEENQVKGEAEGEGETGQERRGKGVEDRNDQVPSPYLQKLSIRIRNKEAAEPRTLRSRSRSCKASKASRHAKNTRT